MKPHKQTYQEVFEKAPFGYMLLDNHLNVLQINEILLYWLGYIAEEITKQKNFYDFFDLKGKLMLDAQLLVSLQMQGFVEEVVLTIKGKNNSFDALINAKKITVDANENIAYAVAVVNVSNRFDYQKKLIEIKRLQEIQHEKLMRINDDLEKFAFNIAHDLKNPLSNIMQISKLLKSDTRSSMSDEALMYIDLLEKSSNHMNEMIGGLLKHARELTEDEKFENISLTDVLHEVVEILQSSLEKHNVHLNIARLPRVYADKTLVKSLFLNLIENAIKYRSEQPLIIDIYFEEKADVFVFYVKDNGRGFDIKHKQKAFEFLGRLDEHQDIEGTGIGLATCKRIVHLHQGAIDVVSEPGKGACFYFTLPKNIS